LKVTGFKKLSSAASSGLQIGDIITQVGDELIIGLPGDLVRTLES
jgi:S1-C subfamily serine protease